MNETIQLPDWRHRFFRRERRSVPGAREFTHRALTDWGLARTERGDDVLLCVSELATNALLHGVPPGRGFLLFLRYEGDVLRVEVHDSGPGTPRIVGDADEGGRGLLLVAAVSDKWGVGERDPGKVVWCEFASAPADFSPAATLPEHERLAHLGQKASAVSWADAPTGGPNSPIAAL